MRLIDAEQLKELFPDNGEGSWTYNATVKAYIDAQPTVEAPDINVGNMDAISRQATKDIFTELYGISAIGSVFDKYEWADICETTANELPSAQPELDIGNDGTLYISVSKGQLDKINRVLVEEDGSIFCKQFY